MHKIYENIYIGNFIFLLGVISERMRPAAMASSSVSVNLYQQTPADPKIGDFFSSLNGRNIIIEFKKDENSIDGDEKYKQALLTCKIDEKGRSELTALSISSHFIGVGKNDGGNGATINFRPYYQVETRDLNVIEIPMMNFIENYCGRIEIDMILANNKPISSLIGWEGKLFIEYLEILASLYDSRRSSSTGGLIVNITDTGEINCLSFPDIQNLVLKLSELNENLELSSPAPEKNPENDFNPSPY